MALTISIKEGQRFWVGEHQFLCRDISSEKMSDDRYYCNFTLQHDGEAKSVSLDSPMVLPGINIRVGLRSRSRGRLARIMIVADGLRVSRED